MPRLARPSLLVLPKLRSKGGEQMSCRYCDAKPRGSHRFKGLVGKPILRNNEGHYIQIEHDIGCPTLPDWDEWRMTFWQFGVGIYAPINYCPICGRRLPPKTEDEAKQAIEVVEV